jgi:hypothetical protein
MVPVFGGPFSLGATAAVGCRHDQPRCLEKTLVRFERWLSVGTGDVSSAQEPLARARGEALGSVDGHVLYAHSGHPVSGAQIFALADPRVPCEGDCKTKCPSFEQVSDDEISRWTLDQLFDANRCRSRDETHLEGHVGVQSVALSDPGTDSQKDGNYHLVLKPGRYILVAERGSAARSNLTPVEVRAGESAKTSFYLVEPGRLEYAIYDEKGQLTPAKIVVGKCFPGKACNNDSDCAGGPAEGGPTAGVATAGGLLCQAGSCLCEQTLLKPLEFGGSRLTDGTLLFDQTLTGRGTVELPPGDYELTFAHGPQASLSRQSIHVDSNLAAVAQGVVRRVVDRRGWTAADFHVHSGPSLDSGLPLKDRITSFLAEEMDFLSSSDHDVLTRFDVAIEELGLRTKLGSQVGVETTTQELGHFIGYPMKFQERDKNGVRLPGNNAPEWRGKSPEEIFTEMRSKRVDDDFVVSVPHPFTYFDYYRIDPVTLESNNSVLAILNPLVTSPNFNGNYDAMELMNGKGFDLIRRPTLSEVQFYSQGLDQLIEQARAGKIDEKTYQRLYQQLATEATRRFLHRTRSEQVASLAGVGADFDCRCGSDGDCAAGLKCNSATMTCGTPPFAPSAKVLPPNGLCRNFRGVIDDWFNMLNRNMRRTGVGGSDVHGLFGYEPGSPRTMLRTGEATNPNLRPKDVVHAILGHHSVVTNGPMIHFTANGAEIGDQIAANPGQEVQLSVRVEKGPYYDIDRVEIYRNGELIHWANACGGTRRTGDDPPPPGPCIKTGEDVVAYSALLVDKPPRDAWYVVIAMGLDGRPPGPVYASNPLSRFGTFEITQRLYDLIPTLTAIRTPRFPSVYPTFPIAITNPIWIDVGGDGWKPILPPPSWCQQPRDPNCPH